MPENYMYPDNIKGTLGSFERYTTQYGGFCKFAENNCRLMKNGKSFCRLVLKSFELESIVALSFQI